MKKILFLDFDGVLHADIEARQFTKLREFASCMAKMDEVEIVISSSWREAYSLEQLLNIFPAALRGRIVGLTPILEDRFEKGGRQREIEAYLQAASLHHGNAAWVALDDMIDFFDDNCPFLILVDASRAFGEEEADKLLAWYAAAGAS